jgi:hypothetical protein
MKTINLEQWINKYNPIFIEEELKDFDLFRNELQYYENNNIWTEIYCENEDFYIIPGLHIVNKFRIFITEIPWEYENIQVNDNEMCTIEEAIDYCISFGEMQFNVGFNKYDVGQYFNENLDPTFNGEMTTGRAKYIAIDYFEDRLEKDMGEFEDEIHNYYSQL